MIAQIQLHPQQPSACFHYGIQPSHLTTIAEYAVAPEFPTTYNHLVFTTMAEYVVAPEFPEN